MSATMKKSLLVLGAAAALASCGSRETGAARLYVGISRALQAADVQDVIVTITGTGITPDLVVHLARFNNQWTGLVPRIPAGTARTFTAAATDGGSPAVTLYQGSATADIVAGSTALVSILAQQTALPDPFHDAAPIIDSVTAQSILVSVGDVVPIAVAAHDPDPADTVLTYLWTASGGTLSAAGSAAGSWTATANGTFQLGVKVTDPHGEYVTASFSITVQPNTGSGAADVRVDFNLSPVVSLITVAPTQVPPGSAAQLQATASDADTDQLTYAWDLDLSGAGAGCAGTFVPASGATPLFTPSAGPTAGDVCRLRVTVTDGRGGVNTGEVGLYVENPTTANYAPDVDSWSQSTRTALGGEVVTLDVAGHDADLDGITFSWTVSGGAFTAGPGTPNATSEILWTVPCADPGPAAYTATVTLTDGQGATSHHDFTVSTTCAASCGQLKADLAPSGNYPLDPDGNGGNPPFPVYCDQDNHGGGWALIAKIGDTRDAPKQDFTTDVSIGVLDEPTVIGTGYAANLNLNRFNAYGDGWTVRANVETTLNSSAHYQYTFWRPDVNANCAPGCAGNDWRANPGIPTKMLWLVNSTSSGQSNSTWLPVTANNDFGTAPDVLRYVFGFRDQSVSGAVDCLVGGVTNPCNAVGGALVDLTSLQTGTFSSLGGDGDGVPHGHGKRGTYWLKNSNSNAAP